MSSLGTSDAAFIDSWYKFADEFSHRESLYEIEHLPNVAIRNSQGDLAAWGVIQVDSTIGKLHTMPQYRKKGLGRVKRTLFYLILFHCTSKYGSIFLFEHQSDLQFALFISSYLTLCSIFITFI